MQRKIFDIKIVGLILLVGVSIFFTISMLHGELEAENSDYDGTPRAVIIDQLHDDMPNPHFQQKATEYLEAAGYQVDLLTTKDVTVDLYKNLPKMNYNFVVVRSHGTTDMTSSNSVVLFTGEKYSEDKYVSEQLFGQVKRATPLFEVTYVMEDGDSSEWVVVNDTYSYMRTSAIPLDKTEHEFFAISPKFVEEAMNGKFHGTTFILGGCDTMSNPSLASALLERGASSVVGWDDTVGNADNDRIMLNLLEIHLNDKKEMAEAVEQVISAHIVLEKMPYPATLKYYSNENI